MKNTSAYAVLTRFGIIAAVLATLVLIAPATTAQSACELDGSTLKCTYDENGTDPVATFGANDPDADAEDIAWSLKGVDADDFKIDEGGVLTFKSPPNYESPTDRDEDPDTSVAEGKGDRKYQITVVASGGEQAVEVEVRNLNEAGVVKFTQLQAQITRDLEASFTDDDGEDDPTWQWSRGESAEGPFTAIDGATSADRSPTDDDLGMWLQATVSYTDSFGATSADGVIGPVVGETLANAAPTFSALDDDDDVAGVQIKRTKPENTKGNIGDPLTARDANGDPRLYTVTGGLDKDCFSIGETSGQLSLNANRNFEAPTAACKTGGTPRTATDDDARDADGTNEYEVIITATDPSGATGTATVTVTITDANEAPEFAGLAKADANVTLYIDENEKINDPALTDGNELALRQNETDADETADTGDTNAAVVAYTATDQDADTLDTNAQIRYSVEGADRKHFTISNASGSEGVLGFKAGDDLLGAKGADFEGDPSYSITIVATSGGIADDADGNPERTVNDVDRTRISTLDVTIKVVDQEDPGEVKISAPEPQEGKSIIASLSDKDGGVTGVTWQWARVAALAADDTNTPADDDSDPDPVKKCADLLEVSGTPGREWADISGATSPIYTPGSDTYDHDGDAATTEVGYCLRATATYTDNIPNAAGVMDTASNTPTRRVQEDDPANTAPKFGDQDPNTPGTQTVAERSVKENFEGKVGEPVIAADVDLLMYSVDDTDNFKVDNGGQISTAKKLDYEALPEDAKYYMVMLTATDPSGASDSVMVKITVTDENDPAKITGVMEITYDENGTAPVATFTANDPDADADDIVWSLKGVDKDDFKIEGGVLTFKSPPNYEKPTDRDEDPDTSVAEGAGDRKYQVTVVASGGEQAVEVEVRNLNEAGVVKFTQLQAQITRDLEASFTDDDGEDDPTWQWSRGESAEGPFTAIDGATSADRSPTDDDLGMWLQATVSYTDSFGATSADGVIGPVVGETLANAAPTFSALDDDDDVAGVQIKRTKPENTKGNIGDPLTARDANGDPRLYTVTGGLDKDCFSIGETSGQLSLNANRNFEAPTAACKTGGTPRTATDDDARDADGTNEYEVIITATDPSGATGTATVTVTITDANEAPEFAGLAKADANVTLYIDENEKINDPALTDGNELALRQNETDADETADTGDTNAAVVAYTATDQDADTLDTNAQIRYSVEGADRKHFTISNASGSEGVLGFKAGDDLLGAKGADFEGDPSYSITIVATSGGIADDADGNPERTVNDVDRTRISTLDVTIKVVDQEDPGEVKISAPEPQEGKSIIASLSDKDGGVTGVTWQWARVAALAADDTNTPADDDSDPDPVKKCADLLEVSGTPGREWADISGATSPIYTPGSDTYDHDGDAATTEVGYCLRATATYTDNIPNAAGVMDTASNTPTRRVQEDDPANTAPKFGDQDPNTPGTQTVAERSVKENFEGKVGEPVIAADVDLLMYSVDDTDNFKVDNGGQISTAKKLDYEALPEDAKYYMVMLTAEDPSGAKDTVMVKITVTDENDNAIITPRLAPEFASATMTRSVAENQDAGANVGDPVTATDPNGDELAYALSGSGSDYFAVGNDGQITTTASLDHEAMDSHEVTITASDGIFTSQVMVTINVTDVNDAPVFGEAPELSVAENSDAGTEVGSVTAMDQDEGTELTYSLDEMGDMYFDIDAMGQITVGEGAMLDYETATSHEVTVMVDDGSGADNATASMAVTIMVTDVDESPCVINGAVESDGALAMDCETLLGIMDELIGEDGTAELNWSDSTPIGEWQGVAGTGSGRVTRIHLTGGHDRLGGGILAGEIPSGITALDGLTHLTLTSNELTGAIPDLDGLDSIQVLALGGNAFTGSIPASLGNLDSLVRLWLHRNDGGFEGGIPAELGNLSRLRYLMLYDNGLTGEIPTELGMATNLKALYLHNNMLSGSIPAELGNLMTDADDTVRLLYLHNNMLTGDVPAELGNLVSLTRILLSGNMLTGCIPAAIIDAADDAERAGLMACADDGNGNGNGES